MSDARYLLSEIDFSKDGLGTIIPLSVEEIIKFGEDNLNEFLTPFLYESNLKDDNVKFFDFLFINDEQMIKILNELVNSLKILFRVDKIECCTDELQNINIIVSDATIHRDNFDKLCLIVREMFFLKPKEEEAPRLLEVKEENRAILEEYLRLEKEHQKEMEELNKQNHKNLHQLVTIVASQLEWDYDKVLNMTYYRLMNSIMSIFEIDQYTTYMAYSTSGQFDMKNQKCKHWSETVGK